VAAVAMGVAFVLPTDGASMMAQTPGDLGGTITLNLHCIDDIAFVHGKMAVRHRDHSVV
jgi:hypothetical protein